MKGVNGMTYDAFLDEAADAVRWAIDRGLGLRMDVWMEDENGDDAYNYDAEEADHVCFCCLGGAWSLKRLVDGNMEHRDECELALDAFRTGDIVKSVRRFFGGCSPDWLDEEELVKAMPETRFFGDLSEAEEERLLAALSDASRAWKRLEAGR